MAFAHWSLLSGAVLTGVSWCLYPSPGEWNVWQWTSPFLKESIGLEPSAVRKSPALLWLAQTPSQGQLFCMQITPGYNSFGSVLIFTDDIISSLDKKSSPLWSWRRPLLPMLWATDSWWRYWNYSVWWGWGYISRVIVIMAIRAWSPIIDGRA